MSWTRWEGGGPARESRQAVIHRCGCSGHGGAADVQRCRTTTNTVSSPRPGSRNDTHGNSYGSPNNTGASTERFRGTRGTTTSGTEMAVLSAVEQVERAEVTVLAVHDDEVIVSDIAERTGRTRQSVDQLIRGERGPGGFPPPRHTNPHGVRIFRVQAGFARGT